MAAVVLSSCHALIDDKLNLKSMKALSGRTYRGENMNKNDSRRVDLKLSLKNETVH